MEDEHGNEAYFSDGSSPGAPPAVKIPTTLGSIEPILFQDLLPSSASKETSPEQRAKDTLEDDRTPKEAEVAAVEVEATAAGGQDLAAEAAVAAGGGGVPPAPEAKEKEGLSTAFTADAGGGQAGGEDDIASGEVVAMATAAVEREPAAVAAEIMVSPAPESTAQELTALPPIECTEEAPAAAGGEEEEDEEEAAEEEDFDWGAAKHIFILSSAGKPVFSLSGDEQRLGALMGLIQALLSLCADCDSGDEMESISAGSRRFVFLKRGNLVLVAVSSSSNTSILSDDDSERSREEEAPECESFMRLQLEYLYASILFLLTSKVQDIFLKSPGYDLRGLLGGADTSLRGIIELAEPSRGRGRMLASGVETVWMDPAIRSRAARALQSAQAASAPSGALYAVWLCEEKLVSLAQPRAPSHRLMSRDLVLLANFVATQPALRNAESWTPVCLPRFQETGYLYAYIAFLEDPPGATPSSQPHKKNDSGSAKQCGSGSDSGSGGSGGARGDGNAKSAHEKNSSDRREGGGEGGDGDSCVILVSVESSSEQFEAFRRTRSALESRFRSALGTHWDRYLGAGAAVERKGILTKFCTQMQALHFYYCLRGRHGGAPCVTQCLSSPFVDPRLAKDRAGQHRVWGYYTRAALRLRRGSCQEGRVFCRRGDEMFDGMSGGGGSGGGGQRSVETTGGGGRGKEGKGKGEEDLATALFESDPVHSLAYEIGDKVTVISLFGQREDSGPRWNSSSSAGDGRWGYRDEMHACFPSSVTPEAAYRAAIRLTAIIRRDREWLFVTGAGAAD